MMKINLALIRLVPEHRLLLFLYRDAGFLNSNQTTNPEITTTDTLYNGLYKITVNEGVYEVYVENGAIWPDSLFTFKHNDGTVYEGYLADNVFTGNCNISYPNGDSYNGDLYNNKKTAKEPIFGITATRMLVYGAMIK